MTNRKQIEIDRYKRLDYTVNELVALKTKSEIKRSLEKKFHLKASQSEKIISAARVLLRERIDGDVREHTAAAVDFYRSIINNKKIEPRERIRAREALDKLLGLQNHGRSAFEIPQDLVNKLVAEVATETLRFLIKAAPEISKTIQLNYEQLAAFMEKKYGNFRSLAFSTPFFP